MMAGFERFVRDEDGSNAVLFAIALLAILVLLGGALDFSNQRTQATKVQAAIDGAVLQASQQSSLSDVALQTAARAFFDENVSGANVQISSFSVIRTGSEIVGTVTGHVETNLLALGGIPTLAIDTRAAAERGAGDREVVLVLDVTASMRGEKIDQLRIAANELISDLEATANTGPDIRVGLVPFNSYVNIGAQNANQFWVDHFSDNYIAREFITQRVNFYHLFDHLDTSWGGCVMSRAGDLALNDVPPSFDRRTHFPIMFAFDEPDGYGNDYLGNTASISDPIQQLGDLTKYGIGPGQGLFPFAWSAANLTSPERTNRRCVEFPIVPLTNNFNQARQAVSALEADGNTNSVQALIWGQRVLSPQRPFTGGRLPTDSGNEKIIVLLTDGRNLQPVVPEQMELVSWLTAQGYAGLPPFSNQVPNNIDQPGLTDYLDQRFLQVCDNVKSYGTEIFVLRLDLTDHESEQILRQCASGPNNYYNVPTAQDIDEAFEQITTRVLRVRLTR